MLRVCPEEVNVGISAYAIPNVDGFSAISKARYSDFIVHEGAWNGIGLSIVGLVQMAVITYTYSFLSHFHSGFEWSTSSINYI